MSDPEDLLRRSSAWLVDVALSAADDSVSAELAAGTQDDADTSDAEEPDHDSRD